MNSIRQWKIRRNLGAFDENRAADVIHRLLACESGIDPRCLLRPDEAIADLWPTLLLLVLHDFIGVSKRADRVWLLSEARRALRISAFAEEVRSH